MCMALELGGYEVKDQTKNFKYGMKFVVWSINLSIELYSDLTTNLDKPRFMLYTVLSWPLSETLNCTQMAFSCLSSIPNYGIKGIDMLSSDLTRGKTENIIASYFTADGPLTSAIILHTSENAAVPSKLQAVQSPQSSDVLFAAAIIMLKPHYMAHSLKSPTAEFRTTR